MSKYHAISTILSNKSPNEEIVQVRGWLKTRRDSKAGLSFLQLNDGSCFQSLQIVAPNSLENYETEVLRLTSGCALAVEGQLVESQGKGQAVELQAQTVKVIGWVDEPESYPISPKRHTMEFLREVAHLRPRTNTFGAMTRIRHTVAQAIHQFFDQEGFYWLNTPILTANDCEGAGEMFRVSTLDLLNLQKDEQGRIDYQDDFFGRETYLTVSGQLNAEAYALAMSKVYTFGPTFRAENSNTSRHLAEFWMIEPEVAFADLMGIAQLAERLLKHIAEVILQTRTDDMAFFEKWIDKACLLRLEGLLKSEFETMEYRDAISILQRAKQNFQYQPEWGLDLQSEHERYIAEQHVGKPVIMINYPKHIKGFYMRLNDDQETVAAMDILAPGIGEIVGGSQREERLEVLDQRLHEMELDQADYAWYRDLRRYGSVPHSGFGMGFERLISYITGVKNVRDIIPFPRTPGNINF